MNGKQPEVLRVLSFAQMCKFFSHYGMRSLLVLYMVNHLQFTDAKAFSLNAVFISIVELAGIFGGMIADKSLGLKRSTFIGGWILALGYVLLLFEGSLSFALGFIILGGSLFSSNITALLGDAYKEEDPRREKGFTIFYMMQNLGALLSTILCGIVALKWGFSMGFMVAASGMVLGNLALFFNRRLFHEYSTVTKNKKGGAILAFLVLIFVVGLILVQYEAYVLPILPFVTCGIFLVFAWKLLKNQQLPKHQVKKLLIFLGALILFFASEDQITSSLMVFTERMTAHAFPSSFIMGVNPVVILLFGAMIQKLRHNLITPFTLLFLAFGGLAVFCLYEIGITIMSVMGIVIIISVAELMIGPLVMSYASEVAAKGNSGMIMGMIPIAFSMAFLLGGGFSTLVAADESAISLAVYGVGFLKISLIILFGGLILQFCMKKLEKIALPTMIEN